MATELDNRCLGEGLRVLARMHLARATVRDNPPEKAGITVSLSEGQAEDTRREDNGLPEHR
jgi:hypothetical protein